MRKLKALVTLSMLFASLPGFAQPEPEPETKIEVSILDLIPRSVPPKHLPKDYGERVARTILGKERDLLDCIFQTDNSERVLQAELRIRPDGKIRRFSSHWLSEPPPSPGSAECISGMLSTVQFPRHELLSDVVVKLPIRLSWEQL